MGTSSSHKGSKGGNPLIPSWLGSAPPIIPGAPDFDPAKIPPPGAPVPPEQMPLAPSPGEKIPALKPAPLSAARNNLSRFARSGGMDTRSLGRSIGGYVASAAGGAKTASRRMGSSRVVSSSIVGILSSISGQGLNNVLQLLNLQSLAGKPIEEIFLGMADVICPSSGTLDEAIARDAFIETIAELAEMGITDINAIGGEQIEQILESYATHAIEARLCSDIGTKTIIFPADIEAARRVQDQIRDFIRRSVSDAFAASDIKFDAINPEEVQSIVNGVYDSSFEIMQAVGEQEGNDQ